MSRRATLLAGTGFLLATAATWALLTRGAPAPVLDRLLANLPPGVAITHGAVAYDPVSQTLTVDDVTATTNGKFPIHAAHLTITGITLTTPPTRIAHVSADTITYAINLPLPAESGSGTPAVHAVGHSEIGHLHISDIDIAALHDVFDPAAYPGGKPAWTDNRVVIGQIDATQMSDTISWPVKGGAIVTGNDTVATVRVVGIGLHPLPIVPRTGLDRARWQLALTPILHVASSTMTSYAITVSQTGTDFNVRATIAGTSARDYAGGLISAINLDGLAINFRSVPVRMQITLPHIAVTGMDLRPITAVLANPDQADPAQTAVRLPGYQSGLAGAVSLDGMAIDTGPAPTPAQTTVPQVALPDMGFRPITPPLRRPDQADPAQAAARLSAAYQKCLINHYEITHVRAITDLANGATIDLEMDDAHGDTTVDAAGIRHGIGHMSGLSLAGHSLPPAVDRFISIFGMDHLLIDGSADSLLDPTHDHSTVNSLQYTLHGLAHLDFSGSSSGLETAMTTPVPQVSTGGAPGANALANVKLERFQLVYTDQSLLRRSIHVAATSAHQPDSVMQQKLVQQIRAAGETLPGLPGVADQLANFIENPGRLTIALAPATPIRIGDIAKIPAAERAARLELKVTAEPPTATPGGLSGLGV